MNKTLNIAYKMWVIKKANTPKQIADKVGKTEKYVARMLKLNDLPAKPEKRAKKK